MKNRDMLTEIFSRTLLDDPMPFAGLDISRWPWDRVVWLAHHHLLAPRLYGLLKQSGEFEKVPPRAATSLSHGALEVAHSHVIHEALAPKLLSALEAYGLRAVVLKGFVLARRYYARPEQRPFHDLDLLFPATQRQAVESFFEGNGFRRSSGSYKFEANAHKVEFTSLANPALVVECHFQLGYGKFALAGACERAVSTKLSTSGSEAKVWHLAAEDEYLFLVFHAAIQHRFQKLGWLLDLALIQRRKPFSVQHENFGAALATTHYFLNHFAGLTGISAQPRNASLDRWFSRVADGSIEKSFIRKAGLRALTQGSWTSLLRYGAQRQWAMVRKP
ncbi:MAG: nucleotidyltransferase family protein [Deltaproteobacteria bacterium]|nr:nucleotidyltransferase family protein [Deltaproteobacteria bacterium]